MGEKLEIKDLIKMEVERLSKKFDKDFLDCEDIIKITGLGRDNVRYLMSSKDFPTIRVGKRVVVGILNFVTWQLSQNASTITNENRSVNEYTNTDAQVEVNNGLQEK